MRRHVFLTGQRALGTVALTCILVACADVSTDHDLVIRGIAVVDVETGAVERGRTIAIDDTLITFVGPDDGGRRRGAAEVDGSGLYAIPGLWDMHVHIEGTDLVEDNRLLMPVYLAYGVTTVRDMASDLGEQVLSWRDEINAGRMLGPRIYTAGRKIEGINSVWKDDIEVANEAEMRAALDQLDDYDVDFVKITENTLPADLFLATVKEARSRGYLVSGHVPYGASVEALASAGISSIEHASHMIRLGSADEVDVAARVQRGELSRGEAQSHYAQVFDEARAIRGYQSLAGHGVYVTPTLIGSHESAYLDETDHTGDVFQRYLTRRFMAPYGPRGARVLESSAAQRERMKSDYLRVAAQLPALVAAGVTLLGGSDSAPIAIFVYPGEALHDELVLFQDAGLTPLQALQTVTINGAKFLGEADRSGTLKVGRLASLVLLRQNPMDDISATRSIETVVSRGLALDRAALDAMLADAASAAAGLDASRGVPR